MKQFFRLYQLFNWKIINYNNITNMIHFVSDIPKTLRQYFILNSIYISFSTIYVMTCRINIDSLLMFIFLNL